MSKIEFFLECFAKAEVDEEEETFVDRVAYALDVLSGEYQNLKGETKDDVRERYFKIVETKKTYNREILTEMWYNLME